MYYFLYFIIYSFLGYLCEVIYVSIGNKKITDRGFLYGPICPVYGYGALVLILSLNYFYENNMWYFVFIFGIIITSLLEYFTGFLLEKIFNIRLWDYSNYKFNINGRVCLKNSFLFGIMALVVFYFVQPIINNIFKGINQQYLIKTLFWCLLVLYIIDTILSIMNYVNLSKILYKLDLFINKISDSKINIFDYFLNKKSFKRLSKIENKYPNMRLSKGRKSIKEILNKFKR